MRIVIAPDKFKGCLSGAEVASAIAEGLRRVSDKIEIDICPLADGGEGTVEALVSATSGRIEKYTVTGPLPAMKVEAPIGYLDEGKTAVIEMSAASGLALLPADQRNPMRTTTYGTGELLRIAAEAGATRIVLGIGGSATIDGGIGCAQAWGAQIELNSGQVYTAKDRKLTGSDLANILAVEGQTRRERPTRRTVRHGPVPLLPFEPSRSSEGSATPRRPLLDTRGIEFVIACDVANPLFGFNGAAPIFGPQKGATPEQIHELDRSLQQLADHLDAMEMANSPGAGAAGGLGFAMMAFFGARIRSGIEVVIEATHLPDRLAQADLCFTGEGRLDGQSLAGKTTLGVARACHRAKIPCVALTGSFDDSASPMHDEGLHAAFSICNGPMLLEEAIAGAPRLLAEAAANVLRMWMAGKK